MRKYLRGVAFRFNQPKQMPSQYPLQRLYLIWGLWTSVIIGCLFLSILAGFSILVLFVIMGTLWRRDEAPVLGFCLAYQWLSIVTGYFYQQVTGSFPGPVPGDLEGATFLSLLGILAIIAGIRMGLFSLARVSAIKSTLRKIASIYDMRRIFWSVIVIHSIGFFVEILPHKIQFNVAAIINDILSFRSVFLVILFLVIFRQRRGYLYGAIALIYVMIPASISFHSAFSGPLILLFICLLTEWRPWSRTIVDRRRNTRIMVGLTTCIAVLFVFALVWQGGVKEHWRSLLMMDKAGESPLNKIQTLASIVEEEVSNMDWGRAWESLAERLSGNLYFSHVLDYVPAIVPHEKGALTLRALKQTLQPRFLFPDKPDLGSSSWLVIKYTGFYVAGEEAGTSIGLTYMAQFYIDFGFVGMFIALFFWGVIVGLVYGGLLVLSPSSYFANAAIIVLFPQPFSSYEGDIAYLLSGLILSFVIFTVVFYFFGPWLHRKFLVRSPKAGFQEREGTPFIKNLP